MSKPTLADRLAAARRARVKTIEVAGTTLQLHKWNYDQSVLHGSFLLDRARKLLLNGGVKGSLKEILQADLKTLFSKYGAEMKIIIADTVRVENFDTLEDAQAWVDEIDLDSVVLLSETIFKENCGPLVKRLGVALNFPELNIGAFLGVKQSTSSPTSSGSDTTTKS